MYGRDKAWRDVFRSTNVHNTVTVDGISQADVGDIFKWRSRWHSSPVQYLVTPQVSVISASHDGYARLPSPVDHHRTIVWHKPEYWLCIDQFDAIDSHDYRGSFHFAPGTQIKVNDMRLITAVLGQESGLMIQPVHFEKAASVQLLVGNDAPGPGWYSAMYGEKVRVPFLQVRECAPRGCVRAYVLRPFMPSKPAVFQVRDIKTELGLSVADDGVVACVVRTEAYEDVILYSPGQVREWAWNGFSGKGELAIVRLSLGGRILSIFMKRAWSVAWREQVGLQSESELEYVQLNCSDGSMHIESNGQGHVEVWNNGTKQTLNWVAAGLKRVCVG